VILAPLFCGEKPCKLISGAEGVSNFLSGRLLTSDLQSHLRVRCCPFNGAPHPTMMLAVVN
jgi:hypothetical protein